MVKSRHGRPYNHGTFSLLNRLWHQTIIKDSAQLQITRNRFWITPTVNISKANNIRRASSLQRFRIRYIKYVDSRSTPKQQKIYTPDPITARNTIFSYFHSLATVFSVVERSGLYSKSCKVNSKRNRWE